MGSPGLGYTLFCRHSTRSQPCCSGVCGAIQLSQGDTLHWPVFNPEICMLQVAKTLEMFSISLPLKRSFLFVSCLSCPCHELTLNCIYSPRNQIRLLDVWKLTQKGFCLTEGPSSGVGKREGEDHVTINMVAWY